MQQLIAELTQGGACHATKKCQPEGLRHDHPWSAIWPLCGALSKELLDRRLARHGTYQIRIKDTSAILEHGDLVLRNPSLRTCMIQMQPKCLGHWGIIQKRHRDVSKRCRNNIISARTIATAKVNSRSPELSIDAWRCEGWATGVSTTRTRTNI